MGAFECVCIRALAVKLGRILEQSFNETLVLKTY